MNTLLPYPEYRRSASALDDKRLFKQVIECRGIITASFNKGGYANHPAVKMWKGNLWSLWDFMLACTEVLEFRSKQLSLPKMQSTSSDRAIAARRSLLDADTFLNTQKYTGHGHRSPWWIGWEEYHSVMRGVLLDKNFEWYSQFGWTEEPIEKDSWSARSKGKSYPYIWPTKEETWPWECQLWAKERRAERCISR
jgi:hypothetical protein